VDCWFCLKGRRGVIEVPLHDMAWSAFLKKEKVSGFRRVRAGSESGLGLGLGSTITTTTFVRSL